MKYLTFYLFLCLMPALRSQDLRPTGCAPADSSPEDRAVGIITAWETSKPASYPGGEREMYLFFRENIRFPQAAKQAGIIGTEVVVSFVVEKDGSITDIQICKDIGYGCGEEAVRIVKMMPKWNPCEVNGHTSRYWMNLPIRLRSL